MPTVRISINRTARMRLTPEVRQLFAQALALRPVYTACIRGECSAAGGNAPCAACREFLALSAELSRLLGEKPWDTSPLDTEAEAAPDYVARNPLAAERWRKAWALRWQLAGSAT